jgi:hypothetical protein
MRSLLIFCWLITLLSGCFNASDVQERVRLDSLINIYSNKPVHVLKNKGELRYAYTDSTKQDTAFRLKADKLYLLEEQDGYPDENGLVEIVLIEGCIWHKGYAHYSSIKELRAVK